MLSAHLPVVAVFLCVTLLFNPKVREGLLTPFTRVECNPPFRLRSNGGSEVSWGVDEFCTKSIELPVVWLGSSKRLDEFVLDRGGLPPYFDCSESGIFLSWLTGLVLAVLATF